MATALLIHGMEALLILGCVGLVAEWVYSVVKDRKDVQPADLPEDRS